VTRILVVNDVHLRDTAPSSATETYCDDLFDLLGEVAKKEEELGADAVVFAGDVVDFKQPIRTSHKLVLRAIDAMNVFKNPICVFGNHDLTQDRKQSLFEQQPLGVIIKGSKLRLLEGWHETLPLYGVGWLQDWNNPQSRRDAFAAWRAADEEGMEEGLPSMDLTKSLVVTHCSVFPPGQEAIFEHVPTGGADGLSALLGSKGFLAYGHIHDDHSTFDVDGVTYANYGALSRGSLDENNRNRVVSVALWDSEEGFSRVVLPQKPADQVFRLTEKDAEKQQKVDLDNFLEEVGNSTLGVTTTESVKAWLESHPDVDPPVKRRALSILEDLPN
jgi:DNA repair exonuclease SbcCD nuclease subunit